MTTLNANQKEFAMALYDATLTGKPLEEKDWKGVVEDDDTAYAVQDEVMRLKGVPVGGYKVSLTSKQTQEMCIRDRKNTVVTPVMEKFLQEFADQAENS